MTERIALSWPAVKFRAVIRAALVAASTDKERAHLSSVYVQRVNTVLTVTATDGYWLFRWKEPEGMTNEDGDPIDRSPFQCLIPRRVLESFVDATKKHVELEQVLLRGEGGQRWQLETIMDVCRHEFLQTAADFPDTDKVIPSTVAPTVSAITVGANMITKVAKAFALATGVSEAGIHWQISGGTEAPLVCTNENTPELLVVVMPRRVEGDANAVPEKPADDSGESGEAS